MRTPRRASRWSEVGNSDDVAGIPPTERHLVALAVALGARDVRGWSNAEELLTDQLPPVRSRYIDAIRDQIRAGSDPLGDFFCLLRSPAERRTRGATFTPLPIVAWMMDWAQKFATPDRVVDPGTGSGRFAVMAGRRFSEASIVGVEIDPLAAVVARANLAVAGLAPRSEVIVADYRQLEIPQIGGCTLFVGNPPYVRHHRIESRWKRWLVAESARRGLSASQLAGLYVHFFLATVAKATSRDFGIFITAAEWLDVNYGRLLRDLFLGELGGRRIVVIEPTAAPFPDAATTAAITAFAIGSRPKSFRLNRVETLSELKGQGDGRVVGRDRLTTEPRWSRLTRPARKGPSNYVELGELCRVHRGQVTGSNKVWIAGSHSRGLPESVLFRSVTRAHELFRAGMVLADASDLRQVIDLPLDLDRFDGPERRSIQQFLARAKGFGADRSYIANNRKAWWSVGLRAPAPILATYMARRPPAFVLNRARARHINIAHGLYPRESLDDRVMRNLVEHLSSAVKMEDGRTYAGGLTKFEPREMERLLVPRIEMLDAP